MRSSSTDRTSDRHTGIDDDNDSWDFEGMMTAEEVATSGTRRKLREIQRGREDRGEAEPTALVDVAELARGVLR